MSAVVFLPNLGLVMVRAAIQCDATNNNKENALIKTPYSDKHLIWRFIWIISLFHILRQQDVIRISDITITEKDNLLTANNL